MRILRNNSSVVIITVDDDDSTALHSLNMPASYLITTFNPHNLVWEKQEQTAQNEGVRHGADRTRGHSFLGTKTRSSGYREEGAEAESLVKQTSAQRLRGKQWAKF